MTTERRAPVSVRSRRFHRTGKKIKEKREEMFSFMRVGMRIKEEESMRVYESGMGGSRRRRWALLGRAPKMRGARVKVMKKEMDGGT